MVRKNKCINQEHMMDCGVACLLMIIRYHGGNDSVENIRLLTKTNKEGTNAYNIIEGARRLGFRGKGFRCKKLNPNIKLPCIAHVILDNSYHHFVVIRKIDFLNNKLIVSDPASGNKKYTYEQFSKIWTNVIIELIPNQKIAFKKETKTLYKFMLNLIKPHFYKLILIFILSILIIVLSIISTLFIKVIIDESFKTLREVYYLSLFFIILIVFKILFDLYRNKILIIINKELDKNLIINTYNHIISLPYQYFEERHTGDIISRINDLSYIREFVSRLSVMFLVDFLVMLIAFIILFFINKTLFIISIIILLMYFIIVYLFSPYIKKYIQYNQEKKAVVNSHMIESIKGIETIKNLGLEKETIIKAHDKFENMIENNYKFDTVYNYQRTFKDFTVLIGINFILFWGSIFIFKNEMKPSDLILYHTLLIYFLEPIKNIFDMEPLFESSINALKRISKFLDVKVEPIKEDLHELKGDIKISNLSFSYDEITNVLSNVNLLIKESEKVLVIGDSGTGKSTLFKLLGGYYNVMEGEILIDNQDINKYNFQTIRKSICYVSQNEFIFTETLYNNIIMGRKIEVELFEKILKITYVDKIANKHKSNYDMFIEENGSNLSGGEKQRVIMARSLLKNANTYIFDESLSQIDSKLEAKILRNIFELYKEKTIIIISHNQNNIDLFDKVIRL